VSDGCVSASRKILNRPCFNFLFLSSTYNYTEFKSPPDTLGICFTNQPNPADILWYNRA